jgi:CDP-diglyceride synthetase
MKFIILIFLTLISSCSTKFYRNDDGNFSWKEFLAVTGATTAGYALGSITGKELSPNKSSEQLNGYFGGTLGAAITGGTALYIINENNSEDAQDKYEFLNTPEGKQQEVMYFIQKRQKRDRNE